MGANPKAFFGAIRRGDTGAVRRMAAEDRTLVDARDADAFGATPVAVAVAAGDVGMVDVLLEAGADIDRKSDWWAGGFAPIHVSLDGDRALADALIARGATVDAHAAAGLGMIERLEALVRADPSAVHERGGDGKTPLHFAGTPEAAAWLLDHGAAIDAKDVDHESTPAQHAVRHRPAVARLLLERGAAADPFLLAGCGAAERLAAWLDQRPDELSARITRERFDAPGSPAEHIYCYLLGFDATLLHVAARCDQPGVIELLAARGLDVNVRGEYDAATPLHIAAWEGHARAASALIDAGADLNRRSGPRHDNEPVGWACVAGRPELVALLIERGAAVRPAHGKDARRGAARQFTYTGATAAAFEACADLVERALAS